MNHNGIYGVIQGVRGVSWAVVWDLHIAPFKEWFVLGFSKCLRLEGFAQLHVPFDVFGFLFPNGRPSYKNLDQAVCAG